MSQLRELRLRHNDRRGRHGCWQIHPQMCAGTRQLARPEENKFYLIIVSWRSGTRDT
jgi:hypothetical protein